MAFHFPQPYVIRLAPQGQQADAATAAETVSPGSSPPDAPLPYRFESVLEARLASDRLCEKLIRFIERLQIAKNNPINALLSSWKQYGLRFRHQLDAWSEAFEPIFRSRLNHDVGHLERLGISALKMFQISTNILFIHRAPCPRSRSPRRDGSWSRRSTLTSAPALPTSGSARGPCTTAIRILASGRRALAGEA